MQSVIGALRVNLGLDSAQFSRGLQQAQDSLRQAGQRMQSIGQRMTVGLTAPIAAMGVFALRAGGDFEAAMNRVAAVSGASAGQLEGLSAVAREMGATTQFSASQAADAMGFLAMAGMQTDQIIGALPATLQLAAAAQMDLGAAADTVTNIMAGYGLQIADLGRVNDVLVSAFTGSNTNLQDLGTAMRYAGPVAAAAGVQFEEAAAAIGLMGNAGIQGSMAGTSLRGAISQILNPTNAAADAMRSLGLQFTDAQGRILPLDQIIEQLAPHAEDAGLFMQLFGQRAGPAMAAMVSQGAQALRNLTTRLEESGGTAERIANAQMQGFNGALTRLKSAFEGLQIAIAESGLLEFATELVAKLGDIVGGLAETNPAMLRFTTVAAGIAAALGPALAVIGVLVATLGAVAAPVLAVTGAIAVAVGIWAAWGERAEPMPGTLEAVTAAQGALNTALGTFSETGAPQAGAEAQAYARELEEQASAALAAAEAELALMQAELLRFQSAPVEERGLLSGDGEERAMARNIAEAQTQMEGLRQTLADARATLADLNKEATAAGSATGDFGAIATTVTIDTGGLGEALTEVAGGLSDVSTGTSGAARGVEDIGKAAEDAKTRLQGVSQGLSRFLLQATGSADGARQAISGLLDRALELSLNSVFMSLLGGLEGSKGGGGFFGQILSSLFSFDGGGYTGSGPRSGGIDGKGGFLSVMHPNETVIDHTKGGAGSGGNTIVNITNNTGQQVETQERTNANGERQLDIAIGRSIGRGRQDSAFARYGAKPKALSR
ncbi:phage tail tape measure protein [Cereibacter sphaeroides]|nr:phage tail tape measure protein [Cereibacter sphaeroides]